MEKDTKVYLYMHINAHTNAIQGFKNLEVQPRSIGNQPAVFQLIFGVHPNKLRTF